MRKHLLLIMFAAAVAGCGGEKESKYSLDNAGVSEGGSQIPIAVSDTTQGKEFGVGDAEAGMRIEVYFPDEIVDGTITQQLFETKAEWFAKGTAEVSSPYPDELPLKVVCRSVEWYPKNDSARVTVNLYVENEIVKSFTHFFGATARTTPMEEVYDIKPHLDLSKSNSFLIHARGEIEYFTGTPMAETSADMEAPESTTLATKMGNPFRITFNP